MDTPRHTFKGFNVITSLYLEEDGDPIQVRRTWRERWLSRPWRPWVTTRTMVPKIPYRGAIRLNASTYVMHPATLAALKEHTDDGDPTEVLPVTGFDWSWRYMAIEPLKIPIEWKYDLNFQILKTPPRKDLS